MRAGARLLLALVQLAQGILTLTLTLPLTLTLTLTLTLLLALVQLAQGILLDGAAVHPAAHAG